MKIYQIHEFAGEYEDYYNIIVGTYLHRETAEKELKRLKDEHDERTSRVNKCSNCPINCEGFDESMIASVQAYCDKSELYKASDDSQYYDCKNAEYWMWDDNKGFEIKEEEVIDV